MKILFNLRAISYIYKGQKYSDFGLMGNEVLERFSPVKVFFKPQENIFYRNQSVIKAPSILEEKVIVKPQDTFLSSDKLCEEMQKLDATNFYRTDLTRFDRFQKINEIFRHQNREVLSQSTMVTFGMVIGYIDQPYEEVIRGLESPRGQVVDLRQNSKGYIL